MIASQIAIHERFGGVVPEIAAREHVRQILPVIDEALTQAGVTLDQIEAVAVATRPGLVGALVVGLTAAKSLALAPGHPSDRGRPPRRPPLRLPARPPRPDGLPVRRPGRLGGPFEPVRLPGADRRRAPRRDDRRRGGRSVRQGGQPPRPRLPRRPRRRACRPAGNPKAFAFPRAFLHDDRLAFSFSGLKTAVLYALKGQDARSTGTAPPPALVADVAASFQEAAVDILVSKAARALDRTGFTRLGIGGGVAVNGRFRAKIEAMAAARGVELFLPPPSLCTDNAAMAGVAFAKLAAGQTAGLDIDVTAGLVRPGR